MNALDIIILTLILYGFAKGFVKGFLVEIASLLALLFGVYGAVYFSSSIGYYLEKYVDWGAQSIAVVSFALLFIFIVWGVVLLGKILTKTAKILALGMINRILGGLFGALKWAMLLSVGLFLFINLNLTFIVNEDYINRSVFSKPLMRMGEVVYDQINDKKDEIQRNIKSF